MAKWQPVAIMVGALLVGVAFVAWTNWDRSGVTPLPSVKLPPKPSKGDKVILPGYRILNVWDDLDAMRRAGTSGRTTEEREEIASHMTGLLVGGDLVEVLDVGNDYAAVDVIRDRFNRPVGKHGYLEAWWLPSRS